jgi:hypothetical protein
VVEVVVEVKEAKAKGAKAKAVSKEERTIKIYLIY